MAEAIYTTAAPSSGGGRDGKVSTPDGLLDQDLKMPPALGGPGGATNPEQLFAAGYAACFHSALRFVGGAQKLDMSDSEVSATVGIGLNDAGGFGLAVELDVSLPNLDEASAKAIVDKAHEVCPYSNATRGNIEVTLTVV